MGYQGIPPHGKYVTVGDLNIFYLEAGTGTPLVLLHGGLATAEVMWGEQITSLSQRYHVYAPDSRGHGRTNNPAGILSYQQMANDVAGFINKLHLQTPFVLGYSDGAQVGIELGLRHPQVASAMVLGGVVTRQTPAYKEALQSMGFTGPGQGDPDVFAKSYPEFMEQIKSIHSHVYGPDYWREFWPQVSELWYSVPEYTEEQLANITGPTLAISGDRDALDEAVRLFNALPQGELAVIPDADHSAVERPLFWQTIDDFFGRQTRSDS